MDEFQYFLGEVIGTAAIPFGVACLVILFKRFRTKQIFLGWSLWLLAALFFLKALGLYSLPTASSIARSDALGHNLLLTICATVIILFIAYAKEIFLWLKKEII